MGEATVDRDVNRKVGVEPTAHILMCAPDNFAVSYRINPWMDPASTSNPSVALVT